MMYMFKNMCSKYMLKNIHIIQTYKTNNVYSVYALIKNTVI